MALAFIVALALPALAGDSGKEVKLAGWITDEWCGKNNANKDGADCARSCAKKGALEHVGHKVVVVGVTKDDETVEVSSIEQAEDDA